MISIAICGDGSDRSILSSIIKEYMGQQEMHCEIGHFIAGEQLLGTDKQYDLIFLFIKDLQDIYMGKAIYMNHQRAKIICLTSHTKYLEQAINEIHIFAYLEKPVNQQKVEEQLGNILHMMGHEQKDIPIVRFKILEIEAGYRIESKYMNFKVNDICYFEYTNRKIGMKVGNKTYFFFDTMSHLQDKMQPYSFYYCHQSYLVNMNYVIDIRGYKICLRNNERIPLAQKRSVEFRKTFSSFNV